MNKLVPYFAAVFFLSLLCAIPLNAQRCDVCGSVSVLTFGVKTDIPPPPFDTLFSYTIGSANYDAYLHWVDLVGISTSIVTSTDPEKDCVEWLDASLAKAQALGNSGIMLTMSQFGVDVPHAGAVKGGDYLLWGMVDSASGKYRVRVFLEDATTRDQVAIGTQICSDSKMVIHAVDSALIQIEPIFETIRTYQKQLRDREDTLSIRPRIKVLPGKTSIKSNDSTDVTIKVYDCDGPDHPLKNRWIKLETSLGFLGADSVYTNELGEAHVMFYSGLDGGSARIQAAYYPFTLVTHKLSLTSADTLVEIDYVPSNRWQLAVNVTYTSLLTSHFENEGGSNDGQEATKQTIDATLYGAGDFTDTSCVFKDALLWNVDGSISNQRADVTLALLGEGASDLIIDKKNVYGHPLHTAFRIELSGNTNQDGIYFWCSADNGIEMDTHHFEHVTSAFPSTDEHYETSEYPDGGASGSSISFPYLRTSAGSGLYERVGSNYRFTGTYSVDTSFIDFLGAAETRTETYQVQVVATPQTPVTGVRGHGSGFLPTRFTLQQNYPNPFNPSTAIEYSLPEEALVHLTLCNVLGQQVRVLVNKIEPGGEQRVHMDANGLPSGIYFYRLDASSTSDPSKHFSQTRKMMLLK